MQRIIKMEKISVVLNHERDNVSDVDVKESPQDLEQRIY